MKGRERALKIKFSVTWLKEIGKLIPHTPEVVLKLVSEELPKAVGEYLSSLIRLELEQFSERCPYRH